MFSKRKFKGFTPNKRMRTRMPASETKTVRFAGYKTDPLDVEVRLPKRHPIPGSEPEVKKEPPPPDNFVQQKIEEEKQFDQSEKDGDMYPIRWPAYTHSDVEKKIKSVLEPLSLFSSNGDEDDTDGKTKVALERPVTPINDEIKRQPLSLDQLNKYVRRRIKARPDVPYLSTDDQQNLAGILMGEINFIWPEIRKQVDDPFLSPEENKELNRRIAVHIVTVCEQLFTHYLKKAQVLNERGIFSGPANMSRLKAQLALDANKFLNILTIRRYIVADIRGHDKFAEEEEIVYTQRTDKSQKKKPELPVLSFQGMIQSSRPKSKTRRFRYHTPEQEAKEIVSEMPSLDTNKLLGLLSDLPERDMDTPSSTSSHGYDTAFNAKRNFKNEEEKSREKVLLKRSKSSPNLYADSLHEDLDLDPSVKVDLLMKYEVEIEQRELVKLRLKETKKSESSKGPQPGTKEYADADLRRLIARPPETEEGKIEEDLPPLLQALTRNAKHDGLRTRLDKKIKELEEKEKRDIEAQRIKIREPTHPQPATVNAQLPGMVVRASDVRVSERVCMSSITIDRYSTVYNDLIDEINPTTVKNLDKKLFLSEEIKEVYREIMKTVPTNHLRLDDDEMVLPAADNVNLSGTFASATLSKRKSARVINPAFEHGRKAPWGEMDAKQWVRTPNNPPKNFLGEDAFAPTTPNMERIHDHMHNPQKMAQIKNQTENMPKFVAEKMARTYASWLQWWKSTVTSDDYMKYLSTTENDYMGAVFHFYDSDDEDEEEETPRGPSVFSHHRIGLTSMSPQKSMSKHGALKLAEMKEKEKKVEELKKVKTKYEDGMWNVNTILMGGLGKDPVLEEEDDGSSTKRQKSADTQKSFKTLHERAAQRHSAKQQEKAAREAQQSRASKITSATGTLSKMETDRSDETSSEAALSPQERLEKVWQALEMPDNLKLDMAIKYSCNEFYPKLYEAIERWERVTELILKREEFLTKLEKFEREASDPNRFFEKGNKGSSVTRLHEAKQRSFLYKRIEYYDMEIKVDLEYIKRHFKDTITYKGRPYEEKIKWDRIEMLYWLQEERKQNAIRYEAVMKNLPIQVNNAQLDPIPLLIPEKVT